jgi:NAD-dependent SIR2 family protein deacetylase
MEKNDLFSELAGFQKGNLKPTQTVVRHAVSVTPPTPGGRYAIGPDEDITEYFDEPTVLHKKVKELAEMIRAAKHVVVYTGAGVSTSTSLPDYRGPNGVWTLAAQGLKPHFTKSLEEIHPTICHMSLVQLEKQGLLKYIVSTNVDGLHLRSGFPREKLAELHGNAYLERCRKCKTEYLRDHDVCRPGHGHDHVTGNKCTQPGCDGDLMDSIINFGENLPEKELTNAVRESKEADLSIVMGTSMRVRPACELPTYGKKNGGKMVIVNLQKTPYDSEASMLVRCTTDDFMTLLLQELNVEHIISTPTGMVYQLRGREHIEKMHLQKIEDIKKSREQPKKQEATPAQVKQPAPSQPLPVPVSKIAGRGLFLVDQQSGQNTKLDGYNIKDLLYIKHSNNSVFEISNKCTKIIVERCDNLVLNIKGGVLTSTLEMIECTNITLNVSVPIFTMQLDNSSSVSVIFSNEKLLKNLVWNRTDQLYIEVKDESGGLKYSIDTGVDIINSQFPLMDLTSVQFITHFVDGQLESEMVIREGAGYATTAREKKIMDDKLEKNMKIMQEFLNKLIKLSVHDQGHSKEKKEEEKEHDI